MKEEDWSEIQKKIYECIGFVKIPEKGGLG